MTSDRGDRLLLLTKVSHPLNIDKLIRKNVKK